VDKFATPIGFGTWDLGTSSYFMTFQNNGHFWTWKEYTGTRHGHSHTGRTGGTNSACA
jgi:hypothetical protein